MYYCVNILLTKNEFELVHLEDELGQNQLHIAGRLSHIPVASQCIEAKRLLTLMGLLRN